MMLTYAMEKFRDVIDTFCAHSGQDATEVVGGCSRKGACMTRYMIYAYLHNELKISANQIGSVFGRTRINVLRGIRVLKGWMRYHEEIKNEYLAIVQKIEGAG